MARNQEYAHQDRGTALKNGVTSFWQGDCQEAERESDKALMIGKSIYGDADKQELRRTPLENGQAGLDEAGVKLEGAMFPRNDSKLNWLAYELLPIERNFVRRSFT